MDEPCSALDPISTGVIEELIGELRRELAVVIVTHNLAQARRVADKVAFMYLGDLVEYGSAAQVFDDAARRAHARLRARRLRVSLAPVPIRAAGRAPRAVRTARRRLPPTSATAWPAASPVSPVRLAFLDVLPRTIRSPTEAATLPRLRLPTGYVPAYEPTGCRSVWLRRYSGLFGLLSVLLLAILVGLLVGHWVTQSKRCQQVLKVEGLPAAAAAAASPLGGAPTATTASTAAATTPKPAAPSKETRQDRSPGSQRSQSDRKSAAAESGQNQPKQTQKLGSSTGKKHQEEVNPHSAPSRSKRGRDGALPIRARRLAGGAARPPSRAWPNGSPS